MSRRPLGPSWRTAGILVEPEAPGRHIAVSPRRPSAADRTAARRRWCAVRADWQRRRDALRAEAEALPAPLGWWAAWLLDALADGDDIARGVVHDPPGSHVVSVARVELVGADVATAVEAAGGPGDLAAAVAWLGRRLEGEDAAWGCWLLRRTQRLPEQRRRGDPVVGADGIGIDPDGDPTRPDGVVVGGIYVRT